MASSLLTPDDYFPLVEARHCDPFRVLGIRSIKGGFLARVLRPDAAEAAVILDRKEAKAQKLVRVDEHGLFEGEIKGFSEGMSYTLHLTGHDGRQWRERDAYSFGQVLGEMDIYLFNEGTHYDVHKVLGAHVKLIDDIPGVHFSVWAPAAQRVSVVGDFNNWDGRVHQMRKLLPSGVWEIFLPGVHEGSHYKFEIRGAHGEVHLKTDPYAFFAQHGLETGCMVFDLGRYTWNDAEWMHRRSQIDPYNSPMSIYEVHIGSWQRIPEEGNRPLSYIELGDRLIPYVKEMGFTHIELMPVMEYPFDGSWGYQVVNYYAPTSRFGNPDEFRNFVDRCHQEGIGVILDWVPGHFPKDAHGLARYDGSYLYEHEDPRLGEHQDWGTLIFNYGRNEVKNFLIGNALFWLQEYHIDGLRVDAVASMLYLDYSRKAGEWIPNCFGGRENLEAISFLKRCNEVCYERHPNVALIAEESTAWPGVSKPTYTGGLGFGFKWNMGWMNDSLRYISKDPVHRKFHQGEITFSMLYAFQEHFILVLSHDEVVHGKSSLIGKMPGDDWQKFANCRMFLAWMWAHPGKKLIFQGIEFGQFSEWKHDASLDWHLADQHLNAGLRRLLQHLNWLYTHEPVFFELDDSYEGYEWINFEDAENTIWSFMRKSRSGERIVFVVNATPVTRFSYRVGVPQAGFYSEVLNTDAEIYGGSNVGNYGGVETHAEWSWQNQPHSIEINVPPLSVVAFKLRNLPVV
ncbi:MAG: 1,4-alpha-glucan branching enzyme [Spartobacteria bacterium AMD-G4]|nr:MAG: 1,4-alpha-glucan branching enzyme [Spartobacteria bacterium AMD-G4]